MLSLSFLTIFLLSVFIPFNYAATCGNGVSCSSGSCCNDGTCYSVDDSSTDVDYVENIALVFDTSSNMASSTISKLNTLLVQITGSYPEDIEVPYLFFDDDCTNKVKSYTSDEMITITKSSSSTGSNFVAAFSKITDFYNKYGNRKNGKQNNILIITEGNPKMTSSDSSNGDAIAKAINAANTLKNNGIKIYVANVNSAADEYASIASVGSTIDDDDYDTVMQLISSNYENVAATTSGSNAVISSYTKSGSFYYRTPTGSDWIDLFDDLDARIVSGNGGNNGKCYIRSGCLSEFGICYGSGADNNEDDEIDDDDFIDDYYDEDLETGEIDDDLEDDKTTTTTTTTTATVKPTTTTTTTTKKTTTTTTTTTTTVKPTTTTTTTTTTVKPTTTTTTTTTTVKPTTTTTTTTVKPTTTTTTTTKKTTTTTTTTVKPTTTTTKKTTTTTTTTTTTVKPTTTTTTTTTTVKSTTTTTTTTKKTTTTTTTTKKTTTTTTTTKKTTTTTTTPTATVTYSTGKCGSKNGATCASGYCCNKGKCFLQSKHDKKCLIEKGCENKYGFCY